jgi:translocation and assembly module TamB
MRLVRRILVVLLVILLLGVFALWGLLRSDAFWRWAGGKAVALAQEQLQGDLRVGEVKGNLFDGLFFTDIVLATPEEELFRARSLEVSLSFWSLVELRPVIGKLALLEPRVALRQDEQGQWNVTQILPPSSATPTPKEAPAQLPVPLRSVRFSQILIIDGEVELTRGGETQQFKNLDLELALKLNKPLTPEQTIQVGKVVAATSTAYGRVSLNGRLTYRQNFLDVHLLEVKSGEQTLLNLVGKADLSKGGQIQANGELALPPGEIHRFWKQWPSAWEVGAKLQVKGTTSQVQVSLTGKVQDATLDVEGNLGQQAETWTYNLRGNLKNLKPDLLAVYDKSLTKKVSQLSPLAVKFHLQGTDFSFPPTQLSWTLESEPVRYGAAKVDLFKLSLTGDKEKQQLQGSVKSNIGQLSLNATGSLFSFTKGKFNLRVDSLKPTPLGLGAPEGTVITAKLGGKFSSPGVDAPERVKLTADLEASGKVGPHPLKKLQGRLTWEKTKLEVAQFGMQLGNLSAELKGTLDGDKLDFSHRGKSAAGGNWPIPAQVGGQFSWEGTVKGTVTDPKIALKAGGRGLSYEKFGIQTVTLNANSTGLPPSKGQVNFQATGVKTPAGVFSQANFQGEGTDKLWNFTLRASGPKGVKIEVGGDTDLSKRSFSLSRAFFRLKNITAKNLGPVVVKLSPGVVVEPATFQINEGRVSLQASITDKQVSGSLDIQRLAAEWFVPKSVPLKGTISAQATLAGQASQPVIEGNVSLGPGSYQNFDFQSVQTSVNYRGNRLELTGSLITKAAGPTLSWDGEVPLRFSLMPFTYALVQDGMRVALQGENVNLSLLPEITREVESAKGPLRLQAKIEGDLNQPEVSGQVSWGAGLIKLRQTGASYQLQAGEIRLQGNRVTIPQLTLKSEGTTTLTGDITLDGFMPDEVRARVQLDNFKAIEKLGSEAFVNGAVTLGGRWPDLAVNGNLGIPRALFRLSFFNLGMNEVNKDIVLVRQKTPDKPKKKKPKKTAEPEVWKNLSIDVVVQAPDNVWVDDRMAKIELSVNINVRKGRGQPLIYSGEVRALEGQVFIVGRTFQVTKGIVDLPGKPDVDPFLDARIEYEMTDVTLYADAAGAVSNPKITLGGDPPITENDWMAYLLYGKPAGALSQDQYGAGVAAGAFSGLATKMILENFLGMSRPFPKGLSFTYQRQSDPLYRDDPHQVVIQYRINKRFSVQSQVGGRNTGGDVLFNHDF